MGIFRKKQQPFDSVGVAQGLLSAFVESEKLGHLVSRCLAIPSATKSRFDSKAHLYSLAIVLMVLMHSEQKHPGVFEVRKSLEKLVFTMPQEDGMASLKELREAIGSLKDLLFGEPSKNVGKAMFWAKGWLQDVGINESNPIRLSEVAMCWMHSYIAVAGTMKDLVEEFGL